jgi:hypothetical protein
VSITAVEIARIMFVSLMEYKGIQSSWLNKGVYVYKIATETKTKVKNGIGFFNSPINNMPIVNINIQFKKYVKYM